MKKKALIFAPVIIAGIFVGQVVFGETYGDPGSEKDPVVSISYINEVLVPRLEEMIEEKLDEELKKKIEEDEKEEAKEAEEESKETLSEQGLNVFEIVELQGNEKLIAGESTELISRTGEGEIISAEAGGISDLTGGKDLTEGEPVPLNHHLLVPRDDGRGIKATTYMILMVRGDYEKERNQME